MSPAELTQFSGVYRSEEVEPIYRIVVENGKLVLRRLKLDPMTLEPLMRDTFNVPVGRVRFLRDAKGRVSGLTISTGRVINLRFTKQVGTTEPADDRGPSNARSPGRRSAPLAFMPRGEV